MARVVICPTCQSKGSVPDQAQVDKIRCPRCGTVFPLGFAAGSRQPSAASSAPAQAAVSGSGMRRSSAAGGSGPAGRPILLYTTLAVSGLAVILLGAVVVLLVSRGGGAGGQAAAPVAVAEPAPAKGAESEATAPQASTINRTALTAVSGETSVAATPAPSLATPVAPIAATPAAIDPQEIIRRVKDAAVYIKNKVGGRTISSGSGFVIEVNGDTVVVATNRHVAVADLSELPPGLVSPGTLPTIEAVFRSGQGKDEQALPAQILAADLSEEMNVDLAFLIVKGVSRPPSPIDPMVRIQPAEGMVYIGAGFPLGGLLSKVTESQGNPSVTITGGRIAALRRNAYGQLAVLQVDGSLQPGNSGGPIIDEKTGKLIGVAVAKVGSVDTIGFVVPADEVRRALAGRVGSLDLTLESVNPQGTANLLVKALLVDPKSQVGGVVVHAAPASSVSALTPNSEGVWPPLPNTRPVELQRDPRAQVAAGHVQVALGGQGASARKILIQSAHRDLRGRLVYSKPEEVLLPAEPGRIVPPGDLQRLIKAVRPKSLALLGPLIDPAKDCRLDKDESRFKIRIDVPGKLHTLSPEIVVRKNQPVHNSPMTLADVDGDFAALVEVTGDISPGATPPRDRQVRAYHFTVQSAGLILYQDKNNFLRLERAGSIFSDTLRPVHRLIIEAVKDGKQAMNPIYYDVPEGDCLLILERRKRRLRCWYKPKESNHILRTRDFALDLPTKLKIGLSASNISAKPFTATFENFVLLSDVTKMDQALGD